MTKLTALFLAIAMTSGSLATTATAQSATDPNRSHMPGREYQFTPPVAQTSGPEAALFLPLPTPSAEQPQGHPAGDPDLQTRMENSLRRTNAMTQFTQRQNSTSQTIADTRLPGRSG